VFQLLGHQDNIGESQETVVQWLGCAAYAHALSIVLAYNKRSILPVKAYPDFLKDGTTDVQEEFPEQDGWPV
jgi:hypothetical protein